MTHFTKALEHLEMLAKQPGFRDHAWLRAAHLDRVELFAGMWAALEKRVGPAPAGAADYRRKLG